MNLVPNDAKHSSNCMEGFMVMTPILKLGQVWWKIQCVFLNIHSQKAFGIQSKILLRKFEGPS